MVTSSTHVRICVQDATRLNTCHRCNFITILPGRIAQQHELITWFYYSISSNNTVTADHCSPYPQNHLQSASQQLTPQIDFITGYYTRTQIYSAKLNTGSLSRLVLPSERNTLRSDCNHLLLDHLISGDGLQANCAVLYFLLKNFGFVARKLFYSQVKRLCLADAIPTYNGHVWCNRFPTLVFLQKVSRHFN